MQARKSKGRDHPSNSAWPWDTSQIGSIHMENALAHVIEVGSHPRYSVFQNVSQEILHDSTSRSILIMAHSIPIVVVARGITAPDEKMVAMVHGALCEKVCTSSSNFLVFMFFQDCECRAVSQRA